HAARRLRPMPEGGAAPLDAVLSRGGVRRNARVAGASGAPINAGFGLIDNGATAVIEVAPVVGLHGEKAPAVPVEHRSTRGLGELMRLLLDAGVRNFLIGLGGSSTNDAGAGMLAALGLKLADAEGRDVEPTPIGLTKLAQVDASVLDSRLGHAHITIMSDVDNPLCGERGAT